MVSNCLKNLGAKLSRKFFSYEEALPQWSDRRAEIAERKQIDEWLSSNGIIRHGDTFVQESISGESYRYSTVMYFSAVLDDFVAAKTIGEVELALAQEESLSNWEEQR